MLVRVFRIGSHMLMLRYGSTLLGKEPGFIGPRLRPPSSADLLLPRRYFLFAFLQSGSKSEIPLPVKFCWPEPSSVFMT